MLVQRRELLLSHFLLWESLFGSDVCDCDFKLIRAGGGTELIPALRHLGEKIKEHSSGRPAVVLLITDGQVGDERRAVAAAKEFRCPVHLLGIARSPGDHSARTRGWGGVKNGASRL